MKAAHAVSVLLAVVVSVCGASEPNAIHNKLPHDTTIQGIPCFRGDAWFYPDGALNECTLSKSTPLGDVQAPRRSIVQLWPDGTPHFVALPRNTVVNGYRVMGSPHLRLSSTLVTTFYASGKVRATYLANNQIIQGVPCRGGGWISLVQPMSVGNSVEFFSDGTLESCRLARAYGGFNGGERFFAAHVTTAEVTRARPAQ
jgi:hypothetical protein